MVTRASEDDACLDATVWARGEREEAALGEGLPCSELHFLPTLSLAALLAVESSPRARLRRQ